MNAAYPPPHLITLPKLGESSIGYISVVEGGSLLFRVERVFWTYYTPESILRGRHAHHRTEQVLVAVAGRIVVTAETPDGELHTFRLEDPNVGLYLPPSCWHTMQYSHTAVQLALASLPYNEQDYIRDYDEYHRIWRPDPAD
ncbi:WxcM-like domain-containing protein [Hymenobacter gummosus]|uniref:WxcM-like domain-containing protein n=1 Tax=Hymenobacter gummosus TaxID=1776032 RepID=A0A3S0QIR7_9BACT|nr:FdtA/QdtA family cupin domain-containing protein [Hymenobacter gummosus]RTQ50626.1 WxcM-like domain-containing protein [Hymenobacter gummosus]